jgi:cytochrome c553
MRSQSIRVSIGAAAALLLMAASAAPVTPPSTHARALAATCTPCHTQGGAGLAAIAPLDGRAAGAIASSMRAFRSGQRAGTVMPQLARGYSDADIDALAQWFAAQR